MQVGIPDPSAFYTKDIVTIIALILGPVAAVLITLWHQSRSTKHAAKERLFVTLMAHRKSYPPTADWANALNLIDVVYADHPNVVAHWQALYDILEQQQAGTPRWNHAYLKLLSEMAKVVGYKSLQQADIDKFYVPQAHGDQANRVQEVQTELLRVLKATKNMGTSAD